MTDHFEWESINGLNAASLRPTDDGRVALSTGHGPRDRRYSTTVLLPASAARGLVTALGAWLSERPNPAADTPATEPAGQAHSGRSGDE